TVMWCPTLKTYCGMVSCWLMRSKDANQVWQSHLGGCNFLILSYFVISHSHNADHHAHVDLSHRWFKGPAKSKRAHRLWIRLVHFEQCLLEHVSIRTEASTVCATLR